MSTAAQHASPPTPTTLLNDMARGVAEQTMGHRLNFFHFLLLLWLSGCSLAQPASISFDDCSSGSTLSASQRINVSEVFGQIVTTEQLGKHLNLTVIGNTGQEIIPMSNDTRLLSTLFTTSTVLTFNIWQNSTFFCSTLRPESPLPALDPNSTTYYCPIAAGPIAFSATVPFGDNDYELFTINTQLRVVDTSQPAIELACVNIATTPLVRGSVGGALYGHAAIIFWVSVSLTIAYWILVGSSRIFTARGRGRTKSGQGLWTRLESAGFVLASAISGEHLAVTPALIRFSTPSMRDILFHTQWCAALSMVAVQWPVFVYPFFAQTAWSTLSYNISVTQGANASEEHWNPLSVPTFDPPSNFADQLADPTSPLFVNSSVPNTLLMFPSDTSSGIASFAAVVGLRPQDLFGVCMIVFLGIIAATIAISLLIWAADRIITSLLGLARGDRNGSNSPPYVPATKDFADKASSGVVTEDDRPSSSHFMLRTGSMPLQTTTSRNLWRKRFLPNSFHGSVLQGNLVRILLLFYLPVTTFSCYQFTHTAQSTKLSVGLAIVAFVAFSLVIPVILLLRLKMTATNKLYDETRTLLMLGPLYNHYSQGSQLFAALFFATNLAFGVTVGCGQRSGTAQAIIFLVVEVFSALITSIWLPWGRGASMGLMSFFFCVGRIIVTVLLVILTPTVSVGDAAAGWVAAAIMFILGLIYLGFLLVLAVKVFEGLIRLIFGIPFDKSRHSIDSGLFGVLGLIGCCGTRRRKRARRSRNADDTTARTGTFTIGAPGYQQNLKGGTSTPRGSSVTGTPSVLRPEQAFRPYREDSDDETGFIMGAWQPFPTSGYAAVEDQAEPSTPVKSGFSRVGGGRAHYESPYAISTASKRPSPSSDNVARPPSRDVNPASSQSMAQPSFSDSSVSVNHQVVSGQTGPPPGAMAAQRPTAHVRTKSQTAIIEDASALYALQAAMNSNQSQVQERREDAPPPPRIVVNDEDEDDEDEDDASALPKRKLWFNIRSKGRRMSEGSPPLHAPEPPPDAEGGGRSFVVVREKRPSPLGKTEFTHPELAKPGADAGPSGADSSNSNPVRPPPIPRRSSRRLSHT